MSLMLTSVILFANLSMLFRINKLDYISYTYNTGQRMFYLYYFICLK
jgi:hypothetical protein